MPDLKLPIEIDRRQRVVAALMVAAVDLPQPMGEWGQQMIKATELCPGLKADEIPNMDSRARRKCLALARAHIDAMLEEIDAPAT